MKLVTIFANGLQYSLFKTFKIKEKATHCLTTLNHVPSTLQKTNNDVYFIRKKETTTESDVTEAGFWKETKKETSTQCTPSFASVCRL